MQDFTLPEVATLTQRAEFMKRDGRDMVKISYVGSKDTIIHKVTPEHMARFKAEWDAYCDGRPMVRRPGTPLTDVGSIDQSKADTYIARNVHNLEELAALSDGQCQALGHGTLTDRKAAQQLLAMRKMQEDTSRRDAVGKAAATLGAAPANNEELAEIRESIKTLTDAVSALVAAQTAKKPGRPRKENSDAAG